MTTRPALDVSALPTFAFGNRSVLWWGTMGLIVIEGTMFALLGASYLYIRTRVPTWPPGVAPPELFWGTVNVVLLLVSAIPNQLAKKAAERLDLEKTRLWLLGICAFGLTLSGVRALEFASLNVWWDTNAYGSATWVLLGFHTVHLLTDLGDTLVLTVLMFIGPVSGKRFVDVSENSAYWYFVLVTWLPIYGLIYLAPRFL